MTYLLCDSKCDRTARVTQDIQINFSCQDKFDECRVSAYNGSAFDVNLIGQVPSSD